MRQNITVTINEIKQELNIDVRASLLDVLRDNGFSGAKEGCGVGECGACAVLVDNVSIDSCLYLALWADGKSIRTIEGECKNTISIVQDAYIKAGAVQCGFCTPGLVMSSTEFVEHNKGKSVTRDAIRKAHSGHLCRCTGYDTIVDAVELAIKNTK